MIFYGLADDQGIHRELPFPRDLWPHCPEPEPLVLHGPGWRVVGWELAVLAWPREEAFAGAVRSTLEILITAGCRVAWVGAEGIPFLDPPELFDPRRMTGGVLAWLTSDDWFGCPLSPDEPVTSATDADQLRLRRWAGPLAKGSAEH